MCGACDGEHHREACQRHRRRYGVLHVFGDDVPGYCMPRDENAATQANLATLAARGIELVGPGIGKLACGDVAKGTLSPVDEIVEAICKKLGV